MKLLLIVTSFLIAIAAAWLIVARQRWNAAVRRTVQHLDSAAKGPAAADVETQLATLPEPVRRYLRTAVGTSPPPVRYAHIAQDGEFRSNEEPDGWRPFHAQHYATVGTPGFVWDATIRMAPGVNVRVRDAFVDGHGAMDASLLGAVRVAHAPDTPELASGALHRYLAEAVWMPTALLPSAGVEWQPLDDSTARASLASNGTRVSLDFHFGEDGMVRRVSTPARARVVPGGVVPTPWQGTFGNYALRSGLRVPLDGEAAWVLPQGAQPYWRGHLRNITYDTTPPPLR
jgi:hypothetical protein